MKIPETKQLFLSELLRIKEKLTRGELIELFRFDAYKETQTLDVDRMIIRIWVDFYNLFAQQCGLDEITAEQVIQKDANWPNIKRRYQIAIIFPFAVDDNLVKKNLAEIGELISVLYLREVNFCVYKSAGYLAAKIQYGSDNGVDGIILIHPPGAIMEDDEEVGRCKELDKASISYETVCYDGPESLDNLFSTIQSFIIS